MKARNVITEEDVQKALQKFLRDGGLIKRLPDEVVPPNLMVGAKWGMYEPVLEAATMTSSSESSA
jgi:hypothetical protein